MPSKYKTIKARAADILCIQPLSDTEAAKSHRRVFPEDRYRFAVVRAVMELPRKERPSSAIVTRMVHELMNGGYEFENMDWDFG